MEGSSLGVSVSLLGRSDFERACTTVRGFNWTTFDEYLSHRDGLVIGLASAGQRTFLVPVSIAHFMAWSEARGVPPGSDGLEAFAGLVFVLRRGRGITIRGSLEPRRERLRQYDENTVTVPVHQERYREWLICLGLGPTDDLLHAYARLTVEEWVAFSDRCSMDSF